MVAVAAAAVDWPLACPGVAELQQQMASLEHRITTFKQEIVSGVQADSPPSERQQWGSQGVAGRPHPPVGRPHPTRDRPHPPGGRSHPPGGSQKWEIQALRGGGAQIKAQTRWGKPVYQSDPNLPRGWKYFDNGKGSVFFKNSNNVFIKNRRNALASMYQAGGYSQAETSYIRDGLVQEGWKYHSALPCSWLYKQYTHKIEGVNTDVLILLSPKGSIFRSKKKIKSDFKELELSGEDLQKLLDFKPDDFEESKVLENPDDNWVYDPDSVPVGWRMKKYTFNSSTTKKVEEVFHYLTPDNLIVRGKKQVFDYLTRTRTYTTEDYNKFHFNKVEKKPSPARPSMVNWSEWLPAADLPRGWTMRHGTYKYQKKVQYKSTQDQVFLSRFKVLRFLKSGVTESSEEKRRKMTLPRSQRTAWDDWRDDDIPCLPGWQFSIGRKSTRRKIRYRSPDGQVFLSRGPLIRYLHENNLKGRQQLVTLKKLLKTNQGKHFDELRTNDRFIKNFEADWNYLLFLKIRYANHEVEETSDPKLPENWRIKNINGVDYFKDPTGVQVFNSRKLVVDFLRRTNFELSDDDLLDILEDSGSESELSESETDDSEEEEYMEEEEEAAPRASGVDRSREAVTLAVEVKVDPQQVQIETGVFLDLKQEIENAEFVLEDPMDDMMTF